MPLAISWTLVPDRTLVMSMDRSPLPAWDARQTAPRALSLRPSQCATGSKQEHARVAGRAGARSLYGKENADAHRSADSAADVDAGRARGAGTMARRPKTAQAVAQQAPDPRMRRRQNQMRATRCGRPQSRR